MCWEVVVGDAGVGGSAVVFPSCANARAVAAASGAVAAKAAATAAVAAVAVSCCG